MKNKDFIQETADKIIESLKNGTAPWIKPWKGIELTNNMPYNPITNKPYNGINSINLMLQNYNDPRWLTYKQAQSINAQVKKGEKAINIFAPIIITELLDEKKKVVSLLSKATPQQLEMLKMGILTRNDRLLGFETTSVFDIQQTTATLDMYPEIIKRMYEKESEIDFTKYNHALHTIMEENNIKFTDKDNRVGITTLGYYIPSQDVIFLQNNLSNVARFKTLTHELAHGLLHKKTTLNKDEKEFQAQMTSNVVSELLGIPIKENDISYVKEYSKGFTAEKKEELTKDVIKVTNKILDSYDDSIE